MGTFTEGTIYATDTAGWASYSGTPSGTIIYVNPNTGNDTTGTGATGSPYATFNKGMAVLNTLGNGEHWLLIAKGTSHEFSDLSNNQINVSGVSSANPIVISSYDPNGNTAVFNPSTGGARPIIRRRAANDLLLHSSGGGGGLGGGKNTAIIGIEFYCPDRDPSNTATVSPFFSLTSAGTDITCLEFFNPFDWFYVEDCKVSFFQSGFVFNADTSQNALQKNLRIRRCIIVDQYDSGTGIHSAGVQVELCTPVGTEENLFDQNGFNTAAQAAGATNAAPNLFNHNFYYSQWQQFANSTWGNTSGQVLSNVISNGAAGIQLRSGHLYDDNTFTYETYANNIDAFPANYNGAGLADIPGTLMNNVVLAGRDGSSWTAGKSQGLSTVGGSSGGTISLQSNITCNSFLAGTEVYEINKTVGTPYTSVTLTNEIVFNWGTNATANIAYTVPTLVLTNTKFDETGANTFAFSDPWRTMGSYYATLPGSVANNTFLGTITGLASGRATLTIGAGGITGPALSPGDAVTWPGQTSSVMVVSGSGTIAGSTYTVACGANQGSMSMSGWSRDQFITSMRGQSKATWNSALTANALNNYIRAGFGVASYPPGTTTTHRGGNHLGKF